MQCALLLEDPVRARQVGRDLAELLRSFHPDSVLSPALGGVIIGHEVAAALGVPFRFTERKGEEMGLRRGFSLRQGERVVIVEDVVTTGRSTLETAALATGRGARVVAIGAIIDRTGGPRSLRRPLPRAPRSSTCRRTPPPTARSAVPAHCRGEAGEPAGGDAGRRALRGREGSLDRFSARCSA